MDTPPLVAILTLTLCAFSVTTAEFVIAGILPEVATDLAISIPSAGHLVTAYALGMIIGGPLLTLLTVRMPRKALAVSLLATFIIANIMAAAAPGYGMLLVARLMSGLVVATFFALAVVAAASLAAPGRQASAVAKVALGFNLAMILGAPLGTAIGQQLGWRATFLAIAALATLALVLLALLVPMRQAPATGSVAGELRVLKSRDLQLALAMTAVGNAGVLMVFVYLAPLLTEHAGFSTDALPMLLLIYGTGATLGNLGGGWLADRALMPAIIGLLGGLSVALAALSLVGTSPVPAAMLVFVTGALAFSVIPGMQTRILATAAAAPTFAIALNASGFQIAAAASAWLGGEIIASGMGIGTLPLAGTLLTLLGALIAFAAWTGQRQRRPAAG